MDKSKYILGIVIVVLVVIVGVVFINSRNKNVEDNNKVEVKTTETKEAEVKEPVQQTTSNDVINLTQEDLKRSIEKRENGITISDVKINANNDKFFTVSLTAKNDNVEERIVSASVKYYNSENKQIGENGFSFESMKPGETKSVESTCYIEENNVNNVKIEITANKIEENTKKDDGTTSSSIPTTNQ